MTSDASNDGSGGRVLVVGEALIDIVRYADGTSTEYVGGSPANLAKGLGRLEIETTLLTSFGDDARGRAIEEVLRASGVRVVQAGPAGVDTSTAMATLDENHSATYIFDIHWDLADADLPPIDHIHVGSIGVAREPGAGAVARLVSDRRPAVTVSYDVNARPSLMQPRADAVARIDAMIAQSDVVKMSDEDLEWLRPGDTFEDAMARILSDGPGIVVVTEGAKGAVAYTAEGSVRIEGRRVDVVDTIGAGDAFMSGFVHALAVRGLLGGDALRAISLDVLRDCLNHANLSAALTVAAAGAEPPTLAELSAAR
ncbi:carbohydrate kinase [Antrihabitans sp. YC2-6]|uniref:carbohydrate kinase family protein n=1 Tax=Antrihabitans sp. YC2-6 TaxID=2799498 RepID=UPI0018F62DAB|nr:carbohydrate kinase [Antrihabitans sp. YC2-6]MBJ8348871.1 carbohydrate kinase [Antrihabitans sp. YC2-6]